MRLYLGIFLLICVVAADQENTQLNRQRTPHNIRTIIRFLLGKLCYCSCGDPNFPLDESRQALEIEGKNEYIIETRIQPDTNVTSVGSKEGRSNEQVIDINDVENKNIIDSNTSESETGLSDEELDAAAFKLLNGENLKENGFPWNALVIIGNSIQAGGAIVTDKHIITSASPLNGRGPEEVKVFVGAHDVCNPSVTGVNSSVSKIDFHPSFLLTDRRYNLAILTLNTKLTLNKNVSLVCLPPYSYTNIQKTGWVASWLSPVAPSAGTPYPPPNCVPKVIRLPILTRDECLRSYTVPISSEKGCLGTIGGTSPICEGDKGTPVLIVNRYKKFELFGIITDTNVCPSSVPALFIRVDLHLDWIYSKIGDGCLCKY